MPPPSNCVSMNGMTEPGEIPANVLLQARPNVTAVFAKDVEDVKKRAVPIQAGTRRGKRPWLLCATSKWITSRRPAVAMTSPRNGLPQARRSATPVIWVQHSDECLLKDTHDWRIVPELSPLAIEPIVAKRFRSPLEGTNLEELLSSLGVAHPVICGAQSNYCVRHTTHAALERGYDVTLVGDAHTTSDEIGNNGNIPASTIVEEQNRNFLHYQLPGRSCKVRTTAAAPF
jgi:hypothetical protein